MARPLSRHPTELELEILKALWRGGPSSVGGVRDAVSGFRDLAYTSVMTIMNIMVNKGYLKRAREGNRYVYRALVTEKETTGCMLRDLKDRAFYGSASAVMLNLLETGDVDNDELRHLRQLVDRRLKEKKS